jgi:hypothetical protein
MGQTSISQGHTHTWSKRRIFTSTNNRHKHRVVLKRRVALAAKPGGHEHILLGRG